MHPFLKLVNPAVEDKRTMSREDWKAGVRFEWTNITNLVAYPILMKRLEEEEKKQ